MPLTLKKRKNSNKRKKKFTSFFSRLNRQELSLHFVTRSCKFWGKWDRWKMFEILFNYLWCNKRHEKAPNVHVNVLTASVCLSSREYHSACSDLKSSHVTLSFISTKSRGKSSTFLDWSICKNVVSQFLQIKEIKFKTLNKLAPEN